MKKDYRKELEIAARQMILVHNADVLIKLILKTILRSINVNHAGIFLYDKEKKEYVVKVSKGEEGLKVPQGFAKVKADNPLISFFSDPAFKSFNRGYFLSTLTKSYAAQAKSSGNKKLITIFEKMKDEMSLFSADALIPGYFRDDLIGVLFLGEKADGKPLTDEELGFLSVLASDVVMAIQNAWLFEDLNKQLAANKRLFDGTISALSGAIEAKDIYTVGHTERVARLALQIAENMQNNAISQSKAFRENLHIAALLHDIGKIAVPEIVLNKKEPLNEEEYKHIVKHPIVGIEILVSIKEFEDVILGVKYHHERYDGKGYPFALKGDEIPLVASIISVADTFDAMTSDRAYRKAMPRDAAIEEIKKNSGKQFHPEVVDAFLKTCQ
ncbi:MAG TPA: hypothetical protein DEE98_07895 [Elusimicrobia bacterium]|nr:MAG: hypothetical protein A2278_00730 [Elusimicrobia bacterium RIFOXYA12_FULL_49_49]OGS15181.1 MAG: hypothetical protein A2251_00740 [Elusimicrobia bacterium RIFOXYA2_FULL_47_53]OGS26949.1 MAG: hypothetical protein A2339_01450 [Elusimicrobia bacterium RIFOXYB12_FULL_50_12]OGS29801.1 MAG: hypothetical protein A2323_01540 [Elusimicrobia bacterium RIFOXYB2_FULL_46_23]HBU70284.1 hypothetical protein [Elusimicrobiota bacterium]